MASEVTHVTCFTVATMKWMEVTVSGAPPPRRDYVTVCNLANKVRVKLLFWKVLLIQDSFLDNLYIFTTCVT